jgi:hypothetical protein
LRCHSTNDGRTARFDVRTHVREEELTEPFAGYRI